jgi:hypothetical protein
MGHAVAIFLATLTALLGLSGVGQAQPPATVQVQGTIHAVDCNANTLTLETPGGSSVYRAAASAAIVVNSAGVSLCALQQHLGAPANVWLTAIGSELVITRIDAVTQTSQHTPAPAPAAPVPYGYPYPAYPYPAPAYYPALAGFVLGTIFVGGLTYLLVHGPYGYYHYPYYGPYYHYYYRSYYHPYYGTYRYAPAYIWTGRGWSYGHHR